MHRAVWSLVTLGLMVLSFAAGRAIGNVHSLPAIAATLPGEESEFSHELDAKVRELFPIGTSEGSLIDYLRDQGFAPEWRGRNEPNAASFIHNGLICKKMIRIFWRADPAGILTDVNGIYESQCV